MLYLIVSNVANEPHRKAHPVSEQPELIDSAFLSFFAARYPSMAAAIRREVALYPKLLTYGWSLGDLILAAKTGYNYVSHTAPERLGRYNWKAYSGPEALTDWLQHYYREMKAAQIGMSLDDFVARWCRIADTRSYEGHRSREIMGDYVKARRFGLSDDEAIWVTYYSLNEQHLYLMLRRKLSQNLTTPPKVRLRLPCREILRGGGVFLLITDLYG